MRNANFICAMFIAVQFATASSPTKNDEIEIKINITQRSFEELDVANLDVWLTNKLPEPIYIRNEQDADWPNLFPCFVHDKSSETTNFKFIPSPLPPPKSKDCFIKLIPGAPFHISLPISFRDFDFSKTGQYKFWVEYRGALTRNYFGLPTLNHKKPIPYSNMILVEIRK